MKFSLLYIAIVGALLTGCNGSASRGDLGSNYDGSTIRPGGTSDKTPEQIVEVYELTNAFRVENGIAPLSLNSLLAQAAQSFSEAMATLGFFDHYSPDGGGPSDRILAVGYVWRTYGENIAYGYATAAAVMEAWKNSSGHRANLLNGSFKDIGIGYYVEGNGTAYWTQDFGAK